MKILYLIWYEQHWRELRVNYSWVDYKDSKEVLGRNAASATSLELQNDLVNLLASILNEDVSQTKISLTDMLGLLGYSSTFDVADVRSTDCSKNPETCRNSKNIELANNLLPLHGFDKMHEEKTTCNLGLYLEIWVHYLKDSNILNRTLAGK